MRVDGLWIRIPSRNDKESDYWEQVSDPFTVSGRLSNPRAGDKYSLLVEFHDEQGRRKQPLIPAALLHKDQRAVCSLLSDLGLYIERDHQKTLIKYLQREMRSASSADLAPGPGWLKDRTYVLPSAIFGKENNGRPIFYGGDDNVTEDYYRESGSLEQWREHIGLRCVNNSRLVLAVCCPFAGPLLRLTGSESGGVHLRHSSSGGKTTTQILAGSVLGGGGPKGFCRSWHTTVNGLEATATRHNDSLLVLDELKQVDPKEAIKAVYMLCNDVGRGRMNVDGTSRHTLGWRLMVLSSGEISLQAHANVRTPGGAEVRLLDIEADAGAGMGLFEDLQGSKSPKEFADELRAASLRFYGTPFRKYLELLCAIDPVLRLELIRVHQDEFTNACQLGAVAPEVGRACSRFSLLAAAGELATEMDITGWEPGEATRQVKRCLDAWIATRGGKDSTHDERQAIATIRSYIEQNGQSHFQPIGHGSGSVCVLPTSASDPAPVIMRDRAGYRRPVTGGIGTEYLFYPETFRSKVCNGLGYKEVCKALLKAGYLRRQEPRWTVSVRLPGEPDISRFYCVSSVILTGGED